MATSGPFLPTVGRQRAGRFHTSVGSVMMAAMAYSTHPLVLQGREALARADLLAATHAADERLRADARDIEGLELRYLIQQRGGELAHAAETLKAVLGIEPRADWAYNELIQILVTLGRRAEAEKLARLALRVNPLNAQAHNLFGTI